MAYQGNFTKKEDVFQAFSNQYQGFDDLKDWYKNSRILFAWHGYGDYDGDAFVLLERDGQLYEVNGSHCSCYELEGQWEPEETSVEVLRHRIDNGRLGKNGYYSDGVFDVTLKKILTRWERKHR